MAKRRSAFQNEAEYWAVRTLLGVLRRLPRPVAEPVASGFVRVVDKLVPKLRRAARTNLGFALPELPAEERETIIDGVFRTTARVLLAFAKFPDINAHNVHEWIQYEGLEHYQCAKTRGRGVLVATAHLGNWELSAFAHALMTETMGVMVRPLDNPRVNALVEARRRQSGNKVIGKRDTARALIRSLHGNEAVGILIDQNTLPAEGVFIDFFGEKACASSAFAKLAAHTRATVIPGFAFWESTQRKYVLRFYPAIPMTGDAAADTQRIHSFFESVIRQYPDQWMWIHRRWKTRPPGAQALY
ncbi:MAG: lysophospholipid acyltransferase family protein [Bryobacteraceae bacterium]